MPHTLPPAASAAPPPRVTPQPAAPPAHTAPGMAAASRHAPVLVWDWPTRSFHWLLAFSFVVAFVTAETERWRLLHITMGYTAGGLVLFRLLWGAFGSRHARFSAFVRKPAAVRQYLHSLWRGAPEHHAGHNPAGAVAVVLMLALGLLVPLTGWLLYNDVGGEFFEEVHEVLGNAWLAVVLVHVGGVVVASVLHRENLARAMFTGRKRAAAGDGIPHAASAVAWLLLAAVLGFWGWQWQQAPAPLTNTAPTAGDAQKDDD